MAQKLDLVGTHEIAQMLDVARQRAHELSTKVGFPEPVATLSEGRFRIWLRSDVAQWAKDQGRTVLKAVKEAEQRRRKPSR